MEDAADALISRDVLIDRRCDRKVSLLGAEVPRRPYCSQIGVDTEMSCSCQSVTELTAIPVH